MTIKNKFPMPIIYEFLDEIVEAAYFFQTGLEFCISSNKDGIRR
jgi:hypothetical protein